MNPIKIETVNKKMINCSEIARMLGVTPGAIAHVFAGRRKSRWLREQIEKILNDEFNHTQNKVA